LWRGERNAAGEQWAPDSGRRMEGHGASGAMQPWNPGGGTKDCKRNTPGRRSRTFDFSPMTAALCAIRLAILIPGVPKNDPRTTGWCACRRPR